MILQFQITEESGNKYDYVILYDENVFMDIDTLVEQYLDCTQEEKEKIAFIFSDAINSVFPRTSIQLCVIHQIRNSMKYISYKDRKAVMVDLKKVYQALTLEEAEFAFEMFRETWGKKHPVVIKSWETNWQELTTYFSYPYGIRRLIYTTNTVEAYHRQLRKVTKTKTSFPTDDSLKKIIYLATKNISKKWTMPLQNWAECISQFVIQFEGRLSVF